MSQQNLSKLTYYASTSYRFRGFVCLVFLVLITIIELFGFSQNMSLIFALIVCFWGGSLFIVGAIKEFFRFYIGFNAFLSLSIILTLCYGIFGVLQSENINNSWAFVEMAFTLMLANFIKARDVGHLKSSFNFIESFRIFSNISNFVCLLTL